jgi:NhaA family Na+:H+ antiporter
MEPRATDARPSSLIHSLIRPLEKFLRVEAGSGLVLLAAALVALLWANSPWAESYQRLWQMPLSFGLADWTVAQSLRFWINEGLMTVFFLVVGLEIRREIHAGALSSIRLAALPLAAAAGGILVPALIFLGINGGTALARGWAVPTATDIAFAVGVLALLSSRVSNDLRALLLAIAIVDDIAAIIVIAAFYSEGVGVSGLVVALAGLLCVLGLQRIGTRHVFPYVIAGFVVWLGLLQAHVHPTIAGVLLGLLTPVSPLRGQRSMLEKAREAVNEIGERIAQDDRPSQAMVPPVRKLAEAQREILSPVVRIEALLHPWVAYGVMPLFALANAGVMLDGIALEWAGSGALLAGTFLALVLGKPVGIVCFSWLAVKLGLAELPAGTNWRGILLLGMLAGIGFTMSIFIANLAFDDEQLLKSAKLAVLAASVVAGACGLAFGRLLRKGVP